MLTDKYVQVFGKEYSLKSLQSIYQKIVDEYFSGQRGIVKCESIGESVAFKVRYIFELLKTISKLPISRDSKIVDIGCERGDMLLLLQQLGFKRLCGINLTPYNPRWLADGKDFNAFFGGAPGKIQYLTGDIDKSELPFENGEVSIAILSDVIEHLNNPGWVLSEVNRVMVSGGLIVVGTPNIASLKSRAYLLVGRTLHGNLEAWLGTKFRLRGRYVGHTREYTLDELKKMSRIYGFEPMRSAFAPTLVLLGDMRNDVPLFLFKLYSFVEKIWPGGRHRLIIVSKKTTDNVESHWIPVPDEVLVRRSVIGNAT